MFVNFIDYELMYYFCTIKLKYSVLSTRSKFVLEKNLNNVKSHFLKACKGVKGIAEYLNELVDRPFLERAGLLRLS